MEAKKIFNRGYPERRPTEEEKVEEVRKGFSCGDQEKNAE
jgi:hypothetical protein